MDRVLDAQADAFARLLALSPNDPDAAFRKAAELANGLFPHQIEGVAFLLGRTRAILADDMGLGKTRQAIVALRHIAPDGPYLVVSPASVKRNWAREIAIADPRATTHVVEKGTAFEERFDWVIVNYDILLKHVDALEKPAWAGIVFDEAHYLKNHTSMRSRLARRLADRAKSQGSRGPAIYLLTGTPLTNRPRDLFVLLQLVGHPLGRSFLSFAKRYCAAERNEYGWQTRGASNVDELTVQLHGVMLRRSKDDVLALPPKLRTWLTVEVPKGTGVRDMRKAVELMISHERVAPGSSINELRLRGRLLQAVTKARQALAAREGAFDDRLRQRSDRTGRKSHRLLVLRGADAEALAAFWRCGRAPDRENAFGQAAGARGSIPGGPADPRLPGEHRSGRHRHEPDCGDAGRVQRSRLGAGQPLAGRGPRVPHRTDSKRERYLPGGAQHDR